ncbi:LuxR family transcriptional regulator [Priestia filamentosa]|uniref:LuxR family transcriptional regulator n=1 Tax=Priestia filamentosa TaxID=1402861 RepID=UPI00397CB9C6
MDQKEELLIGIENILRSASDLVKEVDRLERIKEELLLSNISKAEREVFALALDGHSSSEMQKILFKNESRIKMQRCSNLRKLHVSSMQEAIRKMKAIG